MASEKDIKGKLADQLSEFGRVKDVLSSIKKRMENILIETIDRHYPLADIKCQLVPDTDNSIECIISFPDWYGTFTLSDLREIQNEIGVDEIKISTVCKSPICLIFNLPILPPFQ